MINKTEEKSLLARRKFEQVADVARATKDALISRRKANGHFNDNDYMTGSGVLSETIGLTSLLLMLNAFNENLLDDDKAVITQQDREDICAILEESLPRIYDWVDKDGFTAEPIISQESDEASEVFNKEHGYVDTLTWVLSSSVLTASHEIEGTFALNADLHTKNLQLLAKALKALLESQREDGLWGYRSDTGAEGALYFTYSVGVSFADFFDYILGEIAYLRTDLSEDEQEAECVRLRKRNKGIIEYLNAELGYNVEEKINVARRKLQDWLLKNCLCNMPALARCEDMNGEENEEIRNLLGMWEHTPNNKSEEIYRPYMRFYNLNYTYYLVDLMVTSSADRRFKEILTDEKESATKEMLKEVWRGMLSEQDGNYYLGNLRSRREDEQKGHLEDFWTAIMEETIHNARAQYMIATRTGKYFWNRAELQIMWEHEDKYIVEQTNEIYNMDKLKDPSIAPMALRANTMYSYYISEQPDMTVDRLFGDICNDRAEADDERAKTVGNLWDGEKFNLLVTERSVEALVDYYDYLCKFEKDALEEAEKETEVLVEESAFEAAMNEKIASYLKSKEGQKIIAEAVAQAAPPVAAAPAKKAASGGAKLDAEGLLGVLREINAWDCTEIPEKDGLQKSVMEELKDLALNLQQCVLFASLSDNNGKGWRVEEIRKRVGIICEQLEEFLQSIAEDDEVEKPNRKLKYLYAEWKETASKGNR